MPRGVPVPEVRERLFRAGERVLTRDGPAGVTARAVAQEGGVAVGLLYTHFSDLDEFLAELVIERFRVHAEATANLPEAAGSRTVVENLVDTGLALFESPTLAAADLVHARPGLSRRITAALAEGAPGLAEVQGAVTAYLDAERRLGRIAASTDTEAVGVLLVGAIHHLLLLHGTALTDPAPLIGRAVTLLAAGFEPRQEPN